MLEKLNVVISSLSSSISGDQSSLPFGSHQFVAASKLRLSVCLSLSKSGLNLNKYFYAVKCQATIPADMLDKQQQQQSLGTDISILDCSETAATRMTNNVAVVMFKYMTNDLEVYVMIRNTDLTPKTDNGHHQKLSRVVQQLSPTEVVELIVLFAIR